MLFMKINSPSLNQSALINKTEFPTITDQHTLETIALNQVVCHNTSSIDGLIIDKNYWEKVTFSNQTGEMIEISDTIFDSCDFSNNEWYNSSFHRVIFRNCRLTGVNFAESYINHCQFINCTMPYTSFNFSKIRFAHFEQCDLSTSEFSDLDWKKIEFNHCELEKTTWLNTNLANLNLSSSHFEQLYFSPDKIRGLIINLDQMPNIGLALGLVLDEPLE